VHLSHEAPLSASTTGRSSGLPSGRRILSVGEAINSKMETLRGKSARLDHFYRGLDIPMRNLPWDEDTRHTVEPFPFNNPHYLTERRRVQSFSRSCSIGADTDLDIPHNADRLRNTLKRDQSISRLKALNASLSDISRAREAESYERDFQRIQHKSRAISAYHQRVNGRVCHVL
jgi:hypothetical protein